MAAFFLQIIGKKCTTRPPGFFCTPHQADMKVDSRHLSLPPNQLQLPKVQPPQDLNLFRTFPPPRQRRRRGAPHALWRVPGGGGRRGPPRGPRSGRGRGGGQGAGRRGVRAGLRQGPGSHGAPVFFLCVPRGIKGVCLSATEQAESHALAPRMEQHRKVVYGQAP